MLKVFQFLIRLFFASGVSILQMRKGTFEIRLSMKTMGKKDEGGRGQVWAIQEMKEGYGVRLWRAIRKD